MCTYRSDNSREPIQTRRDTAMVASRLPLNAIYELMNLGAGQSIHMHDSTGAVFTCGSPPPASSAAKPPRASGLRRMHDTPHGCSCKPRSSHAYHAAVRAWHRRASPRAMFIVYLVLTKVREHLVGVSVQVCQHLGALIALFKSSLSNS